MTVENISWSNLNKRILPTWRGSNPQPPDHQSNAHPTEPPRPDVLLLMGKIYLEDLIEYPWYRRR